ncbi:unnamed protein product, partial [Rotaria magnacalcarata]
MAQWFWRR